MTLAGFVARTALTNSFFLVIVRVLVVAPASIGDSFLLDLLCFIDLLGDSAILAGSFWVLQRKKKNDKAGYEGRDPFCTCVLSPPRENRREISSSN